MNCPISACIKTCTWCASARPCIICISCKRYAFVPISVALHHYASYVSLFLRAIIRKYILVYQDSAEIKELKSCKLVRPRRKGGSGSTSSRGLIVISHKHHRYCLRSRAPLWALRYATDLKSGYRTKQNPSLLTVAEQC